MGYRVPIPTGGCDEPPVCYLPVAENWKHVLIGLLERPLSDWFWTGTDEEIEAANAEVAKWVDYLEECAAMPPEALFIHHEPQGTHGGSITSSSTNVRKINLEEYDDIGCGLSSNRLSIPAGTYDVEAQFVTRGAGAARLFLRDTDTAQEILLGLSQYSRQYSENFENTVLHLRGRFTLSATHAIEVRQYASNAVTDTGMGQAVSAVGGERFGFIRLVRR
jgi:hypothetical protein